MKAAIMRYSRTPVVVVLGIAGCLGACGGVTSKTTEQSSPDDPEDEYPSDLRSLPCLGGCENETELDRPMPGPPPTCPRAEPELGGDCRGHDDGLLCTYGDDPRVACRGRYACSDGKWQSPELLFGQCVAPEKDFCPEQEPERSDECIVSNAGSAMVCRYENNMVCSCIGRGFGGAGEPGDSGWWVCHGPPADERCPAVIPNLGEGCGHHAVQCQYAPSVCSGATYDTVFCFNGEWELGEDRGCVL